MTYKFEVQVRFIMSEIPYKIFIINYTYIHTYIIYNYIHSYIYNAIYIINTFLLHKQISKGSTLFKIIQTN